MYELKDELRHVLADYEEPIDGLFKTLCGNRVKEEDLMATIKDFLIFDICENCARETKKKEGFVCLPSIRKCKNLDCEKEMKSK
jgi:hypothetical protein